MLGVYAYARFQAWARYWRLAFLWRSAADEWTPLVEAARGRRAQRLQRINSRVARMQKAGG